ncbi:DNA polymerase subunit Cdc27 [Paraphoma chrysanthemicola]|uniref:DNA polymerase delta subunit 3 n=1 Tax=Paraphoma chrysanthemicola TaxID=798071 RepID=A0A8K0W0X2_9PLEO|nr:DNA polymerase subunit Cdc27 [Paraphoma chrysanthemicola]
MDDEKCRDYLAARVLTENRPVTYRLLSRAIGVPVNTAKWMLLDFHQKQNAKKPNSIHATYLVTGRERAPHAANGAYGDDGDDGDDVAMHSSPFMSSMPEPADAADEPVTTTAIVLVREEELESIRAQFESESSIHIYSLEPGPIADLSALAVCNQEVAALDTDVDPLQRWKAYGSIQNPYIKRRAAQFAPPPKTAAPKPTVRATTAPTAQSGLVNQAKSKATALVTRRGSASEESASGRSTPTSSAGAASLKRADSKSGSKKSQSAGDLFKSFAKTKAKPKQVDTLRESTPTPVEDEPMQGMSEDEGDVDDEPEVAVDAEKNEAARKAREDRQEKLRKMMEDDDEDMPDVPAEAGSPGKPSPTEAAGGDEQTQPEPLVIVENGRRRGRRRVMKKKKVKDEDGYLVTKEEAVWESFSEEEPDSKKLKSAPNKTSSSAKSKPAVKKGQGSIASFFKKA